jgi:hypothetical protein
MSRGVIYTPVQVSAIAGITGWVPRHGYSTSRPAGRCPRAVVALGTMFAHTCKRWASARASESELDGLVVEAYSLCTVT